MTIVVTAATGQLGRLVVENLLDRGVPAADIVATGRSLERLKDLADRGVRTRVADYADPASLRTAFEGARRILLISGNEQGERVGQHRNAIEAAREAGVELVAYTSIVNADTSTLLMAQDHRATETLLRDSGVPFTLLRNSWYLENYTDHLVPVLQYGTLLGSAGDGRVSAATRAEYAAAAAAVLTGDGHAGRAYELGADNAPSPSPSSPPRSPNSPGRRSATRTCRKPTMPRHWWRTASRRPSPTSSPTPTRASAAANCTPPAATWPA